jgi:hypothetical protein
VSLDLARRDLTITGCSRSALLRANLIDADSDVFLIDYIMTDAGHSADAAM